MGAPCLQKMKYNKYLFKASHVQVGQQKWLQQNLFIARYVHQKL